MKKKDMKKSISYDKKAKQGEILEIELIDMAISMLIEEYRYPSERIKTHYSLKIVDLDSKKESKPVFADIVVLDQDKNVEIIVEVKSTVRELYTETNTGNLIFNILGSDTKYGILYNGKEKFFFKKVLGTKVIEVPDVPSFDEEIITPEKLKTKIKFEDLFFRTCDLLRRTIDPNDFGITIVQILFAKYVDERFFDNSVLSNASPEKLQNKIEYLLSEGKKKLKISLVDLNKVRNISDSTLYGIIHETNYFSILKSNPELIIKEIFRVFDNMGAKRKMGVMSIPESISLLMYKFLVNGATTTNIKERKLLLTHVGNGKMVFDVLRHISDEFEVIGEDLREFTNANITVLERNTENTEVLKFLLLLKKFEGTKIFNQEPILFSNDLEYGGIMGFPPIGSRLENKIDLNEDLGNDYISNYIIQILKNVKPSGYFTLIVPGSYLFSMKSKKSREMLLKNNILRGIIQFPSGTFLETMIPPFVLFLQKSSKDKSQIKNYNVFMSDLSKEKFISKSKLSPKTLYNVWENFIELQTINQIIEEDDTSFSVTIEELNKFESWNPRYHTPSARKIKGVKGELFTKYVELIPYRRNLEQDLENLIEIPEIRISDISKEGTINEKIEKKIKTSKSVLKSDNALQEGDILLSIKGTIGKFGLIDSRNKNSTINSNLIILRPKVKTSDILYILGTNYFQNQLKIMSTGSTIVFIRKKDLESILIPDSILNDTTMKKMKVFQEEIFEMRQKLESKLNEFEKFRSDVEND